MLAELRSLVANPDAGDIPADTRKQIIGLLQKIKVKAR